MSKTSSLKVIVMFTVLLVIIILHSMLLRSLTTMIQASLLCFRSLFFHDNDISCNWRRAFGSMKAIQFFLEGVFDASADSRTCKNLFVGFSITIEENHIGMFSTCNIYLSVVYVYVYRGINY